MQWSFSQRNLNAILIHNSNTDLGSNSNSNILHDLGSNSNSNILHDLGSNSNSNILHDLGSNSNSNILMFKVIVICIVIDHMSAHNNSNILSYCSFSQFSIRSSYNINIISEIGLVPLPCQGSTVIYLIKS